jgi:DNA polymerase-3 subunit alpha
VQTNTTLADPKRLKSESDQLYFKSPAEMAATFKDLPEAIDNTIRIAEMCALDLGFSGYKLPRFDVPPGYTAESLLEELCRAGLRRLYGHDDGEVGERLEYELGVIKSMDFSNYFLVVWDFVKFAKDNGILVGPGRGSAAGSIVSYSLGITALDPLKYGLIFERFLNPGRISMPDIDIDFADDRRAEVIDYVVKKYGDDRVAQIVTFGTLAAKASVRDVGRAMGMSFADTDRVAKLIPTGPGVTIKSAMDKVPELKALYDSERHLRDLIDSAQKVEGIARHASTHAAGVVISRDPLVDLVPLQRAGGKSEGDVTTQFTMSQIEEIGLLKMDFLGLSTLTVLGKAVELARHKDPALTIDTIPLDDETAYEMLRRGETVGVFQLEGGMTTRMTIDVSPNCFEDLIALMALIRPGPMEMAPDYISRKHGRTEIEYMHEEMQSILSETYGVALYQEQIIRIANVLAGFSLAEGDGLRKAMGKKLPEEMAKYRDRFTAGCVEHGLSVRLGGEIFDMIERFAGYGFNKAHSAAYAVIAAQTAYMKANYPVEFMAALLTTEIGNTEKIVSNIVECRRAGISVLPPDINASVEDFSVESLGDGREAVRFGLRAIRNVGENAAKALVQARERIPHGTFADLNAFCREVDWSIVSKRVVECLAKCGAFDSVAPRSQIIGSMDIAISTGQQHQKAIARGQIGLFDLGASDTVATPVSQAQGWSEIARKELLTWEKELLGLYMSDHPLKELVDASQRSGRVQIVELAERKSGELVKLVGMVAGIRRVTTKSNRTMAIVELEDLTGNVDFVAFPDTYDAIVSLLEIDRILDVTAKVDRRNEQVQLVCESVTSDLAGFEAQEFVLSKTVHLSIPVSADIWADIKLLQTLDELLKQYEGDDQVVLHLPKGSRNVALKSRKLKVDSSETLTRALSQILGESQIRIEEAGQPRLTTYPIR